MTDLLARFGYLARGVLYITLGLLAGRAAIASHSAKVGPSDALRALLREPHGHALLLLLAAGFASYAIFSFAEMSARKKSGVLRRTSHAVAGVASAALSILCLRLLKTFLPGRAGGIAERPIAWLLRQPWGARALIVGGAIVVLAGFLELYRGVAGRFRERFIERRMGRFERRWAVRVTRFGLAAHAVLLVTIGFLGIRAGAGSDPDPSVSTRGAIYWLSHRRFGTLPLALLAAGLVSYGLSLFILTLYRRKS